MIFFSSAWHIFSAALVFIFGLFIALRLPRQIGSNWRRNLILYLWHTIFCVIYANYVSENGGDAIDYYLSSLRSNIDFSFGTFAIIYINRIFSYYFDLSFFGVCLIFNVFGSIGLIFFDASLQYVSGKKKKLVRILTGLIIFLPSVSFWSAGIGKDALSFMAIGFALWAAIDFNNRIRLMVFSVFVMLLVRPHMAGLMMIALASSIIFRGKISLAKKITLVFISFSAVAIAVPFALKYAGLGELGQGVNFMDYIEERQEYNQDGGGGIDISSMSPPMQLFTYVFRPLPFETHSFAALAASFDNIILILIFLLGIFGYFMYRKNIKIDPQENRMFMWIYSLSAWVILAITTANLGISVRQKWMFVPVLVFLLISMMAKRKEFRGNKSESRLLLRGRVSMKK